MPDNSVKITLEAVDKTKAAFDSLQNTLSLIKWDAIVNLGQKAMQAGRQLTDFLDIGAKAAQVEEAFRAIAAASGVMGDALIDNMKKASGVFVDDTELMILAQRALVEKLDPDQITKLMESARVAARLMGTDVKASFDMIMESVISMRTRGLRAAFPMEEENVFEKYAKSIGATKDDLSEWGKRQALVNEILSQTEERLGAIGPLVQTNAEKIQAAKSAWQEFIETLSKAAAEGGQLISKIGIDMTKGFEEGEEEVKGMFFKTTDELLAYSKKMSEEIKKASALKEVTAPEPDWIKKWVEAFDGLQHSFDQLGIVSEQKLRETADAAIKYVAVIENAYNKGKASAKDLANAIEAANAAMKKLTGEDPTKKLVDLMVESEKRIQEIKKAGYDPEKERQLIQQEIDQWAEARKAIQESVKPTIDISALLSGFKEGKATYDAMKEGIESSPIKIQIDSSEMDELRKQAGIPTESNIQFMGEGSSKKPLGEKIKEIIGLFGSMDDALSGMEAMINFSEMSSEMAKLQGELDEIAQIYQSYQNMYNAATQYSTLHNTSGPWLDPKISEELEAMKSDIMSQMGILQMKQILELIQGFGEGEFQTGGTVPRTGFYRLHKGEEVRTTNQVSMGGITLIQHIQGGGNARDIADQVTKALKYSLSGKLKDALRNIR